jgi:hypothetical protein
MLESEQQERFSISDFVNRLSRQKTIIEHLDSIPILKSNFNIVLHRSPCFQVFDLIYCAFYETENKDGLKRRDWYRMQDDDNIDDCLFLIQYSLTDEKWSVIPNKFIEANVFKKYIFKNKPSRKSIESLFLMCNASYGDYIESHYPYELPKKPKVYDIRNVYLMFDPSSGMHKIGISDNLFKRLKQLACGIPQIKLICSWGGTIKDEQALHALFSQYRKHGEWFLLPDNAENQINNYFKSKTQ